MRDRDFSEDCFPILVLLVVGLFRFVLTLLGEAIILSFTDEARLFRRTLATARQWKFNVHWTCPQSRPMYTELPGRIAPMHGADSLLWGQLGKGLQ